MNGAKAIFHSALIFPDRWGYENSKGSTSGEVRTPALKRGPELESGALTTRPQMLGYTKPV